MKGVASDRMVRSMPRRSSRATWRSSLKKVVLRSKMDAANAERYVLALGALDLDGELVALLDEAKEGVRHEMAVHIGDHGHSPR